MAPDIAFVDAGVATDAKTAREASEANNNAMAKVFAALKAANVDARDIQTSRLSLQPQYAPNRSGPSPVVGYRASNRVTVRIHDVSKVAGVIDTLVGAGANDIGNVAFEVSQASKLLDDARAKGGRRRAPQGGDLRQGRGRDARRAAEHFRRRRRAATDVPRQDGGADGRRANADRAGRGDAVGLGQRDLGDQAVARSANVRSIR